MKDEDFPLSRLLELWERSKTNDTIEVSTFFSYSELTKIEASLPSRVRKDAMVFGGIEEAECKCYFFLPDYIGRDDFFVNTVYAGYIGCYLIEETRPEYSSPLTHRDVLGSLMSLGIKREMLGDIYVEGSKALFFALRKVERDILALESIGNSKVKISSIDYEDSPIKPKYEETRITYESNRLDSILASCFHTSREEAKRLISAGLVHMTGTENPHPDSEVRPGSHISVKGKGKVIFMEESGISKKGKIVATIKIPK